MDLKKMISWKIKSHDGAKSAKAAAGKVSFLKNIYSKISGLFFNKKGLKGVVPSTDDFTRPTGMDDISSISTTRLHKKLMNSSIPSSHSKSASAGSSGTGDLDSKQKKVWLIGNLPTKSQYQIVLGFVLFGLALTVTGYYFYEDTNAKKVVVRQISTELLSETQRMIAQFSGGVSGREDAFKALEVIRLDVEKKLSNLSSINESLDIKTGKISANTKEIQKNWATVDERIKDLFKLKDTLRGTGRQVNDFTARSSQLTDMIERLGILGVQLGFTQAEMNNIFFLRQALQQINSLLATLLLSDEVPPQVIASIKKQRDGFKIALQELYTGSSEKNIRPITNPAAWATYNRLGGDWVRLADRVDTIYGRSQDIVRSKSNAIQVEKLATSIYAALNENVSEYDKISYSGTLLGEALGGLGVLIILLAFFILVYIYLFEKDNKSLMEKFENNRNQAAILRLLDEMSPLSDGDLTRQTTVTEEITGAIADSINMTINDLSRLVRKIKDAASQMRNKTIDAGVLSMRMLEANQVQSTEITSTGRSVMGISQAINGIADKTAESAKVAKNSVEASERGAGQVQASIDAMDSIKANATETLRVVRKLEESSRQISQIVEVLSDITEETSVLALNATVQAAKAGESGRGFKIVADAVQELANRAAEETRRVGALIGATQTDIQTVMEAVNKTNVEVENGVQLSSQAGQALKEITEVSNSLASIVESISKNARHHSETASNIAKNISILLTEVDKTEDANKQTAASIEQIGALSTDLESSVKNFRVD